MPTQKGPKQRILAINLIFCLVNSLNQFLSTGRLLPYASQPIYSLDPSHVSIRFRVRAIWTSIYYVNWTKIEIYLWEWQISPNNKPFFFHIYLQKNFCSFSFLRLEFSFGILFIQFGNFSKFPCQFIVLWQKFENEN